MDSDKPCLDPGRHRKRCAGVGSLPGRAVDGQGARRRSEPSPIKEIGWGEVNVVESSLGEQWFGPKRQSFTVFHWHGETFSIPLGATRLLSSRWCANQAFSVGKHLGLQCHIEMTADLVRSWCDSGAREIERSAGPAVEQPSAILAAMELNLPALHQVADNVYRQWVKGLV